MTPSVRVKSYRIKYKMEEVNDALVWLPCKKTVWKKARILEKVSGNQLKVQILSGLQDGEIEIIDNSQFEGKISSKSRLFGN